MYVCVCVAVCVICFSVCLCVSLSLSCGIYECMIEGSLEVKLPTIWTDEKQRWSRGIEKRSAEERRSEKRKSEERRCRCAKR